MRAARRSLFFVAGAAAAWTIAVALTGGFGGRFAGVAVASRDPLRPFIIAVLAAAFYGWRFRQRFEEDGIWLARVCRALIVPITCAVGVGVFALGVAWGTFAAGGSDASGYVSQADLWLHRELRVPLRWASDLPWPIVDWTVAPLGYRPATVPHAIVPAYSAGLPLLMAGGKLLFGPMAPFYVVPIFGALTIWLTYLLGKDWSGRPSVGGLAALLVGISPIFLYQLMWPMTDVPVAALWTAVFLAGFREPRPRPLVAGLAAGAMILMRPNLALLTAAMPAGWLWPAFSRPLLRREAVRTVGWYTLGLAPAVIAVAGLQSYLYGSPLSSGYGTLAELYSVHNVLANLSRYSRWLNETQTPLVALGILALLVKGPLRADDGEQVSRRTGFCAAAFLLALSYLTYAEFDAWWYLRFFLPILPSMLVLVAAASLWLVRKTWMPLRAPLLMVVFIPLAAYQLKLGADRGVFEVKKLESRYAESAQLVVDRTPAEAVILSMQHSGSIRYYTGRDILRYDLIAPEWLDRAVATLGARGRPCFLLLDEWEEPIFRARFGAIAQIGRLDWKPIVEVAGPPKVHLFAIGGP